MGSFFLVFFFVLLTKQMRFVIFTQFFLLRINAASPLRIYAAFSLRIFRFLLSHFLIQPDRMEKRHGRASQDFIRLITISRCTAKLYDEKNHHI